MIECRLEVSEYEISDSVFRLRSCGSGSSWRIWKPGDLYWSGKEWLRGLPGKPPLLFRSTYDAAEYYKKNAHIMEFQDDKAGRSWEQKILACSALGPQVSLCMRSPGNWYASQSGVVIADRHMETGKYGNGPTPEAAAIDHFECLTEYQLDEYVKVSYIGSTKRVRWNGFMWMDYEPLKEKA